MAAPTETVSDSESGGDSSSDAEELARCREAAMPAWGLEQHPQRPRAGATNNQLPTSQPSLRHKVDEHKQNGNELQTTPEFRAHIAKKLGALLDNSITISEVRKPPKKAEVQKGSSEDDGFRLFFTSIPGSPEKEAAPQPSRKRRPASSSEDSDEERQRCQEAAVSVSDILQESAIHRPVQETEAKKEKRKLKKKAKKVACVDPAVATTSRNVVQSRTEESGKLNGDQVSLGIKKKKRKKKAKKASETPPSPPAHGTVLRPTN
ncbi:protein CUSTOS isoform X2 [Tupaia chinensis]|uniref:protein CUSTOS isoform X2 n=1 Tax=Tupaia chinensis TaxID=246437 RepID=UPI0003C8D8F6|nr:protein CUSTOS isoform X2 [Tupaia chinensis]